MICLESVPSEIILPYRDNADVKFDNVSEKSTITLKKNKGMSDYNGFLQFGLVVFLILLLFGNIGTFFFIKNSTRDLRLAVRVIDKDIIEENRKLAIIRAEFSKKYNTQELRQMAKDRLNLSFSNVKQIKKMDDVLNFDR